MYDYEKTRMILMALVAMMTVSVMSCDKDDGSNDNGNGGGNVTGGGTVVAGVTRGEWIDLGLPSGLLWYSCNLGATAPEGYGDYYAWGETTPKSVYDWNTYHYGTIVRGDRYGVFLTTLTKYNTSTEYGTVDNITTLLPEDDAATQVLGSGARIPTKDEWQELKDNTTVESTTVNGVEGRKFTGPNGNSIFLPAVGYRSDDELYAFTRGCYWSASLYCDILHPGSLYDKPCLAWSIESYSDFQDLCNNDRGFGLSVRAVRSSAN